MGATALTDAQLAQVYYNAGFRGSALATMVAISIGESGGRPDARNKSAIEDSRGISQINLDAHPRYDGDKLYDPSYNAKAAFDVSGQGKNFGPWSVYTKGVYRQFVSRGILAASKVGSTEARINTKGDSLLDKASNLIGDANELLSPAGPLKLIRGAADEVGGAATGILKKGASLIFGPTIMFGVILVGGALLVLGLIKLMSGGKLPIAEVATAVATKGAV